MLTRRDFSTYISSLLAAGVFKKCQVSRNKTLLPSSSNIILSTWNNTKANAEALKQLTDNQLDIVTAVEKGINVVEADENDHSVGYGGRPDRNGKVTLDACIMDPMGNAGSVTYLQNIMHAVSVARLVMDKTPHVILSGKGAKEYALSEGFTAADLLTEDSKKAYIEWLKKSEYSPNSHIDRHDTIGLLASSSNGDLAGGCSTSGLSFKMDGRVGDSPIIGAGLFVDNEIGAATATGLGELVLKTCASFLVVELIRQGNTPQNACEKAIKRIAKKYDCSDAQVGLISIGKNQEIGAFSLQSGFSYTLSKNGQHTVYEARSYFSKK